MNKNDFLAVLRGQMAGRIPTREVNSQVEYYSAYIDSQVAKGISEEEAVEELGDPRLIAKTLIESTNRAAEAAGYDGPYRKSTDSYDDSDGINSGEFGRSSSGESTQSSNYYGQGRENAYRRGTGNPNNASGNNTKSSGSGCGGFIAIIIVLILVIAASLVAMIVFSIRTLGIIVPIVAVVVGIVLLVKYLGRR